MWSSELAGGAIWAILSTPKKFEVGFS